MEDAIECNTCTGGGRKRETKKRSRNYSIRRKNTGRFFKQRYNSRKKGVRKNNKRRVKGGGLTIQPMQPYSPINSVGITPNSLYI